MALSPKVYSFFCACFAALGAAVFGYDLGVIAYVIEAPDFLRTTGLDVADKDYVSNWTGFIVSVMLLGAFVSAVPAGLAADRFSRRSAITGGSIVFLIGGILQTAAVNKEMMLIGRLFAGFGIGGLAALAPTYNSEIAQPSARGRMLATFQFFIGIGAFIAGWIAYGVAKNQPGTAIQWRLPLAFQMLPAIPLVFVTLLLPESPRWLMIKGREEESLYNLAKLHARGDINDPFVRGEFEEMRRKVHEEAAVEAGWGLLFKDSTNLRKLFLGIILQFSVQMTGVSAIQYYSPRVFASVGFSTDTTFLISSINNVVGLIGQALCIAFLDKTGRRWVMIGGNAASGVLFAAAASLARKFVVGEGSYGQGVGFVAVIYIYNLIFSACIGPLSWVYPAEICNTAIRAKSVALSSMAAWIANFMIGQVSPIAFNNIGWQYYLVFTVCSFTNALTFYLFYPETKGRSLEEMDYFFKHAKVLVPLDRTEIPRPEDTESQQAAIGAQKSFIDEKTNDIEHRST